jgi:hypothetical protein
MEQEIKKQQEMTEDIGELHIDDDGNIINY